MSNLLTGALQGAMLGSNFGPGGAIAGSLLGAGVGVVLKGEINNMEGQGEDILKYGPRSKVPDFSKARQLHINNMKGKGKYGLNEGVESKASDELSRINKEYGLGSLASDDLSRELSRINTEYGLDSLVSDGEQRNPPAAYDFNRLGRIANITNIVGQGIGMTGAAIGLARELRREPSEKLEKPHFESVALDTDQSPFVRASEREIERARGGMTRRTRDAGVDPLMAEYAASTFETDARLGVYAQAHQTRQQLDTTMKEMNTRLGFTASQIGTQVDQFNIQKQIQENQMRNQAIMQNLFTLAQGATNLGSTFISNKYMTEMMKRDARGSEILGL